MNGGIDGLLLLTGTDSPKIIGSFRKLTFCSYINYGKIPKYTFCGREIGYRVIRDGTACSGLRVSAS